MANAQKYGPEIDSKITGLKVIISNPDEIKWNDTPLPDVHSVDSTAAILAWIVSEAGTLSHIKTIYPYEDNLNPLRWCFGSTWPLGMLGDVTVKYWAWISK